MKNWYLIAVLALAGSGYWFFARQEEPPPPPPQVSGPDPELVKNRRAMISTYERLVSDLEAQNKSSSSTSPTYQSRVKQIADYKARIARMKAEINE